MLYNPIRLCIAVGVQVLAIVGLFLLKATTYLQPESLIYPCCCWVLGLSIWSLGSWFWVTRKLFDPYTIFLVSAILFNAGQAILEVFHLNRFGMLRGQFSAATLSDTLFFITFGLSAFHLGALLSLAARNAIKALSALRQPFKREGGRKRRSIPLNPLPTLSPDTAEPLLDQSSRRQVGNAQPLDTSSGAVWMGWGLASISVLPSIYVFLQSLQVVLTRGYEGLYQGEQETSAGALPGVIGEFLIPAAVFLLAGSSVKGSLAYSKRTRNIALALMILYVLSRLLLGQRRKVGSAASALVWLWHEWVVKLPATVVVGCAIALALIFPIVAAFRNLGGQQGNSLDALQTQLYGDSNPVVSMLTEMGGTMMTTAHTMNLVPSARPFQMGADYGYALLTLVPNFFWKLHPTIERGLAGSWLTWAIDPEFASRGGGYGYSFIAEAYLNFGWVGGPIALGIIGFLYTSLVLWAINSRSPARIALIATFSVYFPFYARSEAALHVRALVWYAVMPYWGAVGISKWLDRQKIRFGARRKPNSSWLR
jgi:oligosaccharide repeat unit polymerase